MKYYPWRVLGYDEVEERVEEGKAGRDYD